MSPSVQPEITQLLEQWGRGDGAALERLMPHVYPELRRIAARQMRSEREGHTLQPTALVNEAFVRLCGMTPGSLRDRGHFFAAAARIMRNVLTDHARARHRDKRGAGAVHVPIDEAAETVARDEELDLAALDDALRRLEDLDPRKVRVVELRFFAGLGIEETADALGISAITVRREWMRAKAWLYRELSGAAR
jgi:RNA polymerase sigma-70 factor (ECF subfamily)